MYTTNRKKVYVLRKNTIILALSAILLVGSSIVFGYHYFHHEIHVPSMLALTVGIFGTVGSIGWRLTNFDDFSYLKDIVDRSEEHKDKDHQRDNK